MKLIAQALADVQVPAPLFAATVPIYNAAMGMGHEGNDTAAVFDVLERMSSPPKAAPVKRTATKKAIAKSGTPRKV